MNQRYRYEDQNRGQYADDQRGGRRGQNEGEYGRGRRAGAGYEDDWGGRSGGGQGYRQDPGQGFSRDSMSSGAYGSDEESQDYFDYYGQGRPTRHGYGDPDAGRSSAFRSYGGRGFNESPRESQREGQRWFDQQGGYGGGQDMYDRQRQGGQPGMYRAYGQYGQSGGQYGGQPGGRYGGGQSDQYGESGAYRGGGTGMGREGSRDIYGSDNAWLGADAGPRRQGQGFRGKGPKGYQRTNERLQEDINERLMDDDDIDASEISVQCRDGVVTLEGTVSDRWMKYRAEDLVERCHGVKDIENRLRVSQGGGDDQGSQATGQEGGGANQNQKKKH